jgi:hypothetical protein
MKIGASKRRLSVAWRVALFSILGVACVGGIAVALDHYITTPIRRHGTEKRINFRLDAPYGSLELLPGTSSADIATIESATEDLRSRNNLITSYNVDNNSVGSLRVGIGTDEGMRSSPPLAMWYAHSGFVPASARAESDMGSRMRQSNFGFSMPRLGPANDFEQGFGRAQRFGSAQPHVLRVSTDAGTSVEAASPAGTRIHLTKDLPIDFSANLGFGESILDLSGLMLTNAMIETGASGANIFCNQPNPRTMHACSVRAGIGCNFSGISNLNADRFKFEGAFGRYHLGFEGHLTHNLDAVVEIGVGMCFITIPPTAARVQVFYEPGILSSYVSSGLVKRRDGYETSAGFDRSTSPILTLHLSSSAGKMSVSYH